MSSRKPGIDICVATFKRPNLLKKLLSSLITQETRGEFTYDIIIVDNDVQRSAEKIVRHLQANQANDQKIIYDVEPKQNISLARNRSLAHATSHYIATIDDDEYAHNHWLINLYKTIISYEADIVHGPIFRIFEKKVPHYIEEAFTLPNPTTGSTENYVPCTGNSMFRKAVIENMGMPFKPSYGKTGSGDAAFFQRLKAQGYKMVWAREAHVYEYVPPERARVLWILKRDFRTGNHYYRVFAKKSLDTSTSKLVEILRACKRIAKSSSALLLLIPGLFLRLHNIWQIMRRLRDIAFEIGIIAYLLNIQYQEYAKKRIIYSPKL